MKSIRSAFLLLLSLASMAIKAQEDPGRANVGKLQVTVYHATNADPELAGERAARIAPETEKRLQNESRLKFAHYRVLGAETQPIFRTYENWAQPLKPSDEILIRYEARSQPGAKSISLDLELWISRKKILKTDALLQHGRPLYVLGPEWRGGRLIIAVALAPM
ncbi:MAG: hypothetical protein H7Y36_06910 [Armatimonadetes bacterium]|nr:hypothetical protein [Akkermansiaceae bacterium]